MEVTLLIENAKIHTFDDRGTIAEALATVEDRIVAVGSNKGISSLAGAHTSRLDLGGRTVLPGFIDAHQHLASFSQIPLKIDLSATRINSKQQLIERVKYEADHLPKGEWIRGRGYDDTRIAGFKDLSKDDLDVIAPLNPVVLVHVSGHLAIVNSEALRRASIDENTPDPKGGKLGRDTKTGKLNGQIVENALFNWFHLEAFGGEQTVVPPFERIVRNKALIDAARLLNASGLTSVTDAAVSPSYVTSYHDLRVSHSMPLRVNMLMAHFWIEELETLGLTGNWGDEWVRCTGIKLFIDGAIAGRTAALRDGYSHDAHDHGVLIIEDLKELKELVSRIHRLGYQACMHANGDLAISMALEAIESAQSEYCRSNPRHRLEHCSIIDNSILERMHSLGVMAIPFGSYLWQHGEKLLPYYGRRRAERMFAHKSFLEAGVRVAGSSDAPAGLYPPLLGVKCMVTRKTASGEVIGSDQKISLEEAFKMYTVYAAHASFEEGIKGSLTAGKLADMVVLSQDPWAIAPDGIGDIGIYMTILGGRIVYPLESSSCGE